MSKTWGKFGTALFIATAVLLAASACGGDSSDKTPATREISITEAWARNSTMASTPAAGMATPAMGSTPAMGATANASMVAGPRGAAYMVIKNTGTVDDALIGAESTVAAATEVHETVMSGETASMRQVKRVELKAGASLELKPGSYHVMLIGLKQPLTAGSTFSLTLKFEQAGSIPITVDVRAQ